MAESIESRTPTRRNLAHSLFWYSVNIVRRTMRHATKNTNRVRRHVYHRARYTSAGRAMLAVSDVATSPRDAFQRRSIVSAYNRRHPNRLMDRQEGYTILQPGALPGTDEIVPIALRLFEEKKRKLEASIGPDTALHAKKWAFLRSVLTNQDLAQNPELVDFALSDGLLSLVTNYLGTIPHLNRVDLLYSVSHGGEEAISSQIYHLDPEGRRQAKLFLNLRDIGPDEGPFTFIPASASTRIIKAIKDRRSADPEEGETLMGRYLDDELSQVGGLEQSISVMGSTGSAVLVDTSRCLHCGSRVKPGTYRLCLYIQYCSSREHGNLFDYNRHATDPVRYLATVNSRRSANEAVAAPHQMS
jgi:hypothetical protein